MKRSSQHLSPSTKARKQRERRAGIAAVAPLPWLIKDAEEFGKREPDALAWVYILKLSVGRYYIGKTERPKLASRMAQHSAGGVWLTSGEYRPVGLNAFPVEPERARSIEARLKGWYVEHVGPRRVRGGGYEPPWDENEEKFPFPPLPSWIDYNYEPAMNAERLYSLSKRPSPETLANKKLEPVWLPDSIRRPTCPLCDKQMTNVKRRKNGSLAFWACEDYPKCWGAMKVNIPKFNILMDTLGHPELKLTSIASQC